MGKTKTTPWFPISLDIANHFFAPKSKEKTPDVAVESNNGEKDHNDEEMINDGVNDNEENNNNDKESDNGKKSNDDKESDFKEEMLETFQKVQTKAFYFGPTIVSLSYEAKDIQKICVSTSNYLNCIHICTNCFSLIDNSKLLQGMAET